ncbi:MAG: hypothetical protein V4463_22935 [Pseudomonadota bacterium]
MKFAMTGLLLGLVCGASFAASVETETRATAAYYTSGYDGAELRLAAYRCITPVFPAVSMTTDSVRKVEKSVKAWQACYGRFALKLNNVLPAGKAIPDDVAKAMGPDDKAKAKAMMEKVYAEIAAEARDEDDKVKAAQKTWQGATDAYAHSQQHATHRVPEMK